MSSETTVQYLKDADWVENPGALFGRLLGETIAARTGRVVLDPSQYSHDPGTRLTGQLLRFGLDPAAMQVVVTYDAAIARGTAGGVATNRFEARVPVAAATPKRSPRRSTRPPTRSPTRSRPGWARAPDQARLFETCSNTSLLRPGVARICSSAARIIRARVLAEAAPAAERRHQLRRVLRVELVDARGSRWRGSDSPRRSRRGARAGSRRTRRAASAAGSD